MRQASTLDVKICGLTDVGAIDVAIEAGANHVGFVHFPPSPRHLDINAMASLARRAGGRAITVAVVVDPDDALLARLVAEVQPDWLQLHGGETPERVAAVRARFGRPVMKAVSVGSAGDLATAAAFIGVADRLLLDSKRPKGSALPGGNGVSFDWRLLAALDPALDYVLSGGLDAGNVSEALRLGAPGGIDVSSGVESAPGQKDPTLIRAFFAALGRARATRPAPEEALAP